MDQKLDFFERNKSYVNQDSLNLLKEIFKQGSWNQLIEICNDRHANQNFFDGWGSSEGIYSFAFEYAIFEREKDFIRDLINHKEILKHLSRKVLYHFAREMDDDFQSKIIAFMVENNSSLFSVHFSDYFSLYEEFQKKIRLFFRNIAKNPHDVQEINKLENFIKIVLNNKNLNIESLRSYYKEWVLQYVVFMNTFGLYRSVRDIFLKFLPNDKSIRAFWVNQTAIYCHEAFFKQLLRENNFDKEEIEMAINDYGPIVSLSTLNLLVEKLENDHPIKIFFDKIKILTNLNSAEKCRFIVTYQDELFGNKKSYLINFARNTLIREEGILLISHIAQDPSFRYSDLFTQFIYNCDDELICRYLEADHTPIPSNFLDIIILQKHSNLEKIISSLAVRKDYRCKPTIFRPLYSLFLESNLNSIESLLKHNEMFLLLKNYYTLHGDLQLSMEHHGLLMPLVFAWYLWKAKDKAVELFLNLTKEQQEGILKGFVPRYIDRNEPSIRSYILQLGISELIEMVGGLHPRIFQKNEAGKIMPIVPKTWKNPAMNQVLIKMQRRTFMKHARQQSKYFNFADTTNEGRLFSQKAAKNYDKNAIYLQHQTQFSNSEKIVSLGYLQTRSQIENTTLGQASGGLTFFNPSSANPGGSFIHMTRLPELLEKQEKTIHFLKKPLAEQGSFILNCSRLLAENRHINFIIIGPYNFFGEVKKLKLSNGFEFISDPQNFAEKSRMKLVEFNENFNETDFLLSIYTALFELVFDHLIIKLDEPLKSEIIQKLTEPNNDEDRKLATDLLNLLFLEWLIPGNLRLKSAYVERVDYGENQYSPSALYKITQMEEESKVLAIIREFKGFEQLPFLVNDVLNIALKRKHKTVVQEMCKFLKNMPNRDAVYHPTEVYEIESLVQLILEDLNDTRVYLHYMENQLLIYSTLRKNSHHGGAHHAEMAKLHFALGVGNIVNQNALCMSLADNLVIPVGENEQFKSLLSVLNALLTFEVTTLLTCYQNQNYYEQHNGDFHPITGKGATNGKVALLKERLYKNGSPYQIQVLSNKDNKSIEIESPLQTTLLEIAKAIHDILTIPKEKLIINDNKLIISMTAWDFIVRLRQTAIFYEGINVITEEGKILMAYRHNRGLASAGGHHGDKYSAKGVGYGLFSEFGLKLKAPILLTKEVVLMNDLRFSSKTGLYILSYNSLFPTEEAKSYAFLQKQSIPFKADPEEFQINSEVALTLSEMRGKYFYDVMPIAELCQYQLNKLKETIADIFPEAFQNISITIDDTYETVVKVEVSFKVPSKTFGQMCFSTLNEFPQALNVLLENCKVKSEDKISSGTYLIDASPFELLNQLRRVCENKTTNTLHG